MTEETKAGVLLAMHSLKDLQQASDALKQLSYEAGILSQDFEVACEILQITPEQIATAIEHQRLEEHDIGMFCPGCRRGVHKHLYNTDNKEYEISYCPWCGEKLDWS